MPEARTVPAISTANRNLLATSVLVDELVRNGLRDVCISPGSRCAPLTLAFARRDDVRKHVHVDERCAAFFALGLARVTGRPVALVCTSGSAAANYHPAVMEAFETGVPLLVLGADRPARLVDSGANQTTVQAGLFGPHVLRSETWDLPRAEGPWLRWLRGRVCRLVELATRGRGGPIHLNLPFEEPLSPVEVPGDVPASLLEGHGEAVHGRAGGRPWARAHPGRVEPSTEALADLRAAMSAGPGVLVAGPMDADPTLAQALRALSNHLHAPLLADPLSGVRGPGAIGTADAILRVDAPALRPAWALAFGRVPVSKPLFRFLGGLDRVFQVDPHGRRDDPEHVGPTFLRADPRILADRLCAEPPPTPDAGFLARWQAADAAADAALSDAIETGGFLEGRLVRLLADVLPDDAIVQAASSMPVRELDAFDPSGMRIFASRGVSGIDGLVSTTFGVAAGHDGPTVGLLGDLATLHDVGGLAAARRLGVDATLVVINNGGGAIFEHLPLAKTDAPVREYFVVDHAQTFGGIAEAFGIPYAAAGDAASFEAALCRALAEPGPHLIEVAVDRDASLVWHRATWAAAAAAVERAVEG